MQENKCFHGCSFTMFMVYTQPLGRGIKPDEEYGNVPLSFTTEFCYSGFHDSLGYQFFQLEQKCKAMASTAPAVLLVVNNHHFPPNYGLCCAHSWPGSTPAYQQLCSQKQMQMKQFQGNYVADIVFFCFFFFPGQNKTDEGLPSETKHINHGQRVLWHCEEELAGRQGKEEHCREEGREPLWRHAKRESSCRKTRKDADSGWGAVG